MVRRDCARYNVHQMSHAHRLGTSLPAPLRTFAGGSFQIRAAAARGRCFAHLTYTAVLGYDEAGVVQRGDELIALVEVRRERREIAQP